MARPTKYDPSFVAELENYLATTGREQTKLPTVEGFALWLGVSRDSLYEWSKLYPAFSDTLGQIEHKQKEQLVNDGIYGGKEVNATIVKLLLQNNHGMREKQELTGNDGGPLNINLYTGTGFTPPPETGVITGLAKVQSVSLAQESTEDIDGTQ
jgi:hypothetical protein